MIFQALDQLIQALQLKFTRLSPTPAEFEVHLVPKTQKDFHLLSEVLEQDFDETIRSQLPYLHRPDRHWSPRLYTVVGVTVKVAYL